MTMSYPTIAALFAAFIGGVIADFAGWLPLDPFIAGVVLGVLCISGAALWIYSPLPDSNGSLGASQGAAGFWGFTKPEEENAR